MASLCRDCFTWTEETGGAATVRRCTACGRPRLVTHDELRALSIAHLDCDAFYASVEKRDRPDLRDVPLIIGGGKRGVVSTCCYIARISGVRSAMPMFKALKACPEATVLPPDMTKYVKVAREIRQLMNDVSPLVEPISIDEAFLDLSGTERLHHAPPAETMARLVARIEAEIGVTASVGLSHNKFLAKVASDLDKPRGFSVIGERETMDFLAAQPVSLIWGVGKSFERKLKEDGITRVAQLQKMEERELMRRYGAMGERLFRLSRGMDARHVVSSRAAKSISAEITFGEDVADLATLERRLWRLCEKVSARTKAAGVCGTTVTLKLKDKSFKGLTRAQTLPDPTQLADVIYRIAQPLLAREVGAREFRLIGVGLSHLRPADIADPPNLLDPESGRRADAERAMDRVRAKYGAEAIGKGRGMRFPETTGKPVKGA